MKSKRFPSLVILLILFVTSCSTPPSPNQNGNNQGTNIEIQITGTESKELGTETISQPNCTGVAEVANTIEKSRTIEYVIEVQNGVSVNANGQVGFAGTDVELGATIASQFGQSYGTSETLTRSITVKANPSTNMQHIIRQAEIWKVGQAKISVGGQQTIIPFKFRSDFAIELTNSRDLKDCGTISTGSTISPTTQSFAPTSTNIVALQFPLEVSVSAVGWVNTNIEIHQGDKVTITYISGQWKAAPDWDLVGPKGDWRYVMSEYRLPSYPLLTLIGRIGDTTPFFVGEDLTFTATTNGELQLGANDIENLYGDNDGSLIVKINVEK
jgi:hypothetical protein